MSHYTVAVFTKDPPTPETIAEALAPFREEEMLDGGKWDWYKIGGRWQGSLLTREPGFSLTGETGLMTEPGRGVDACLVFNLDLDAMLAVDREDRSRTWARAHAEAGMKPRVRSVVYGVRPEDTEETFVSRARALQPFAFVHGGEWHERGSMGWWAIVNDEKPDWDATWDEALRRLQDHYVTIVDCHI